MTNAQEKKVEWIKSEVNRIAAELGGVVWKFDVEDNDGRVNVFFRVTENLTDMPSINIKTGKHLDKWGCIFVGTRGGMSFVYYPKRGPVKCSIHSAKRVEDIWVGGCYND